MKYPIILFAVCLLVSGHSNASKNKSAIDSEPLAYDTESLLKYLKDEKRKSTKKKKPDLKLVIKKS